MKAVVATTHRGYQLTASACPAHVLRMAVCMPQTLSSKSRAARQNLFLHLIISSMTSRR